MQTSEIRRRYLDFFERHGHTIVPSASLVHNDPNLLFVVAGMVPMVPYFTGLEPLPWPSKRTASCQKCLRTLDIDEVGKTTRHGTFFQMLGNFSFGDYFKAEIIPWTWEFLTGPVEEGNLGFDPERLSVSVLGAGFHPAYPEGDVEARSIWQRFLPDERIYGRDLTENYWHMGVPGPGGPDSEIFFDRGEQFGPAGGPDVNDERYLEIWNNVFQQEVLSAVRRKDDFDVAHELPTKNIDTGAGLERIAMLLQGKHNLYEIDEVFPVVAKAAEMAGKHYGDDESDDVRLRVVGDHVRSALMLMGDGVRPGNEARGYVLRRLVRRSIRSMRLLGVDRPVLVDLLDTSRQVMVLSYPELNDRWGHISQLAAAEEETFRRTLSAGTQIFEHAATEAKQTGQTELTGDAAFKLHDTYGFPIDLTLEMASEQGLTVDAKRFTELMTEQKQRAKADAKAKKGAVASLDAYKALRGTTGEIPFLGYDELVADGEVLGILRDGIMVQSASQGEEVELVLSQTPFYAESGGQDADSGIITGDGLELDVVDVQRPVPGLIVHTVTVTDGEIHVGSRVTARVDEQGRFGACQAHTATHVIHEALLEVVGEGATQAGSYNKPGYLRFDFAATCGLTDAQRQEVEGISNDAIRQGLPITYRHMPLEEARALGAQAMFGEKYPEIVRVVEIGGPWSRELCGGTHVTDTARIGMLNLLGEASVGSGVRRVEALVSADAFSQFAAERALVNGLTDILKVNRSQLVDRVGSLVAQLKAAEKQLAEIKAKQALAGAADLVAKAEDLDGTAYIGANVVGVEGNDLRALAIDLRDRLGGKPGVVALVGGSTQKPAVVVTTTAAGRDAGLAAGPLVGLACAELGGRGGGKDDLAQGGGSDASKAEAALVAVRHAVAGASH